MALLKAKCTSCGADLQVDGSRDAAICPYCGSAFVVEKAVANFYGSSVGSINASVVNIYGQDPKAAPVNTAPKTTVAREKPVQPSEEFLRKVDIAGRFSKAMQRNLFLKSDGTLGLQPNAHFGIPTGMPWLINYEIFRWTNIRDYRLVICSKADIEEPFVVALTFDGRCYADKLYGYVDHSYFPRECMEMFRVIRSWSDIVQICQYGTNFVGLRSDGSVVSTWRDQELAGWRGVRKLACCESGNYYDPIGDTAGLLGLTADGHVLSWGVKNWTKKAYDQWSGIMDITLGYGLTKDHRIIEPATDEPMRVLSGNALSLHRSAPDPDGSFSYKSWDGTYNVLFWDAVAKLGKGYVYGDGQYYLSEDGRVDEIRNYTLMREVESNAIACVMIPLNFRGAMGCLKADGKVYSYALKEPLPLLAGDPADYGRKASAHVPDTSTKACLIANHKRMIEWCENMKRSRGLFSKKSDLKEAIAYSEKSLREIEKMK